MYEEEYRGYLIQVSDDYDLYTAKIINQETANIDYTEEYEHAEDAINEAKVIIDGAIETECDLE